MLFNKQKFAVGDIISVKLITGDEVMGKFVEDAMVAILLETQMT